ncbi:MAG: glutamate formimidoyltransferase [Elusimicrobia bacterium]|nr:glutamate formimidoyltransferase [Elusimicrobiota bacterium]
MLKLVQCVPNFSEGRDRAKVEAIVGAIRQASGVVVLDVEMDSDHNRCVITFAGPPESTLEGAFLGAKKAVEIIDLRIHKGEHPRMGAVDVIPFTPLFGVTMLECVELSKKLGDRLARELELPVYLYALSAQKPERENLASVLKGEFEGLREVLGKDAGRDPDFGPASIHPTAGAVAVGAREHIINFNVNLKSRDLELAEAIAKTIRASGGGLPYVRAKGIDLKAQGAVQISTVLTNYPVTGLKTVYEKIRDQARGAGISIESSELIGMVPSRALENFAVEELKATVFNPQSQILENRLIELLVGQVRASMDIFWPAALKTFCEALAKPDPIPGGGSASAALGAIGLSLVIKTTLIQQRKNAGAPTAGEVSSRLNAALELLAGWKEEFLILAQEDSLGYQKVVEAYRIPKTDPVRVNEIQNALKYACQAPLKGLHLGLQCMTRLVSIEGLIGPNLMSDFKVGLRSLASCCHGAKENVLINLGSINDESYRSRILGETEALISRLNEFGSR